MQVMRPNPGSRAGSPSVELEPFEEIPSRWYALSSLPPCVYFVRMPDGIVKIGHSGSMAQRMANLGGELLAFIPHATIADERAVQRRFAHLLDFGREWFRPGPDLLAYIAELRAALGLAPATP